MRPALHIIAFLSLAFIPSGKDAIDPQEQQHVIHAVASILKQHYVDPNVGQKMADALHANERRGDHNAIDGDTFAVLLTEQIRNISHDQHLEVVYSQTPLPNPSSPPSPQQLAQYRKLIQQQNCGFEKVAILPHNIGYLKLNTFPDPSVCGQTARAAMASLNNASALIFDLRDNRGGDGAMVSLIAAWLFDHPEYLYNPREAPSRQSWTQSPVPGSKLADKPVYILTSSITISAAEQFCYNMKMLRRATLVGETTRGAAHAGVFHPIDDHFGVAVTEVRTINPYSSADWEGTGVHPDVKVNAADALTTAGRLAEQTVKKR